MSIIQGSGEFFRPVEYFVVTEESRSSLQREVNKLLEAAVGVIWEPQGGVTKIGDVWAQAMVRYAWR